MSLPTLHGQQAGFLDQAVSWFDLKEHKTPATGLSHLSTGTGWIKDQPHLYSTLTGAVAATAGSCQLAATAKDESKPLRLWHRLQLDREDQQVKMCLESTAATAASPQSKPLHANHLLGLCSEMLVATCSWHPSCHLMLPEMLSPAPASCQTSSTQL